MKPQTLNGENVRTSGNMEMANQIVMDISVDDRVHLMSLLSNMYSDRILACIREYSTNARDAHIMSGIADRPIEVSLPNAMSQFFRVRDFGEGLDIAGLTKYYAQYGASAKRDSDDTNGTLGIGCKAALTYSPTFSVVSVHNGTKYSVAITLNEDNIGVLNVVSQVATDEPSGVEVSIPVKRSDYWDFEQKAKRFYRWWDPKHFKGIKVDFPNHISSIGDGLFTYSKNDVGTDLIIMGGVAYPIPYEGGLLETDKRDYSIVYRAQMGEVVFAPSREALMTVSKTKRAVDKIRGTVIDGISKSAQKEMKAQPSGLAAMVKAAEMRKAYGGIDLDLKYKGKPIPSVKDPIFKCREVSTPRVDENGKPVTDWQGKQIIDTVAYPHHGITPRLGARESTRYSLLEDYDGWNIGGLARLPLETAFITGAPKDISAAARKTVRDFYDLERAAGRKHFSRYIAVQSDEVPGLEWLGDPMVYSWDAVKKVVRDANKTITGMTDPTKYDFYAAGDKAWAKRQIADKEKVLVTTSRIGTYSNINIATTGSNWAKKLGYAGVVVMGTNRWAKFLREHPNSVLLHHAVAKHFQTCYDGKDEKFMRALAVLDAVSNGYNSHAFSKDEASQFDDPLLREVIKDINDPEVAEFLTQVKNGINNYTRIFYYALRDGSLSDASFRAKSIDFVPPTRDDKAKELIDTFNYYAARVAGNKYKVEVANALYFTKKNRKVKQ